MKLPTEITINTGDFERYPWTVTVRYSRPLRFRFWLALRLVRVAAWLVGGSADVGPDEA